MFYDEEYVRAVTLQAVPAALRIEDIETASFQGEELEVVRECLQTGDWEKAPKAFVMVRNELTNIGQIVLRGTRIVVPRELATEESTSDLAHEGHQGIVKTKERLRSKGVVAGNRQASREEM